MTTITLDQGSRLGMSASNRSASRRSLTREYEETQAPRPTDEAASVPPPPDGAVSCPPVTGTRPAAILGDGLAGRGLGQLSRVDPGHSREAHSLRPLPPRPAASLVLLAGPARAWALARDLAHPAGGARLSRAAKLRGQARGGVLVGAQRHE